MKKICWKIIGQGNINLILIHGWGLNSKIWNLLLNYITDDFKCYIIDLPGSGINKHWKCKNIENTVKTLHYYMPNNAVWLGWSMGSLIAKHLALSFPKAIKAIISICSSPCFIKKSSWPGIKKDTLSKFYTELSKNYTKTIKSFLKFQTLITEPSINRALLTHQCNKILSDSKPEQSTLKNNFKFILNSDYRQSLLNLKIPLLRIYGTLDSLVPIQIAEILDIMYPNSYSYIIKKSAHMPFLSHPKLLASILLRFKQNL
ncbi:pimeloyl-ACP methyl ester esterase BioH [Buchnera aphidicola (Hormaphis cornu)]|nr:pimeloyl-ACP methyl ester esterase BioH [Buchnera aphidicola (Hormaphis cornu)]